jgi:T-complex protein 1 subunit eta
MSSKLIHSHKEFFTKMVVDAVLHLDQNDLNEKLIGIKKVPGGAMQESLFVNGVAFKKTFSYAGFEQQPKCFKSPTILSLNVELELKAERDNAEVRIEQVSVCFEILCLLVFENSTIFLILINDERTINPLLMPNGT